MNIKIREKYNALPVEMKASLCFLISNFMQKAISILTTPIFTRLLSSAEYGRFSVFNSWSSVLSVFVTLNLFSGMYTQALVKFENEKKVLASSFQGLCATLSAIWLVVYLLFHEFFNLITGLSTIQMVAMILMIWTSAIFKLWAVEQRNEYKYKLLFAITIACSICKPLIEIFLVLNSDDKVTARILGLLFVELIFYVPFFIIQIKKGKVFWSRKFWKYGLQFNIPLIPHYLSSIILNCSDRIMIERMVGEDAAGIYSLSYSVSMLMNLFNSALLQAIEPWIYRKIKKKEVRDIKTVAYPAFILVAILNLILIFFSPEIISIFAPSEYLDAIIVVPPIAMSVFFMFLYSFFASFEFYYEKKTYISTATMLGAIANVILNYIFIGKFGYHAAGFTTLFCYIVFAVLHYLFMRKICKKNLNNEQPFNVLFLIGLSVLFMMCGFACLGIYEYTLVRYAIMLIAVLVAIIMRKKITKTIKMFLSIKKQ